MRFKTYNNGVVTLTIEPGQSLEHSTFERTDEGYSASRITWELSDDGQELTRFIERDGSDCDGRLSSTLHQVVATNPMPLNEYGYPDFQDISHRRRDYRAEAAGY